MPGAPLRNVDPKNTSDRQLSPVRSWFFRTEAAQRVSPTLGVIYAFQTCSCSQRSAEVTWLVSTSNLAELIDRPRRRSHVWGKTMASASTAAYASSMHSLEKELRELAAEGALDSAAAARAIAAERRTVFSLFGELRAALYAAVALVVTGVGILVKEHLDRIGPLTLMFALALAGGACYVPAIRARLRGAACSSVADYLLLLGALLVSADLGYAETQFHWLGANWSRHLLILTAFHAFTAYIFESRRVLSVALTSLAGWFGIERGPGSITSWQLVTPALGLRALLCAGVMFVWRAIDQHTNGARFREMFEHFAANLAFWGALSWCSDTHLRVVGVLALLALAWVAVRAALRSATELFAVYGVGYTALGLSIVVGQVIELSSLSGAVVVLVIVLTAAAVLRYLHDRLKDPRP